MCEIITALGIEVVPEVSRISQISSPWIRTSGSPAGDAATTSPNSGTPAGPGSRPRLTAIGRIPAAAKIGSRAGHRSASTTAVRAPTRSRTSATMSSAIIVLTGTATSPALAMAIFVR